MIPFSLLDAKKYNSEACETSGSTNDWGFMAFRNLDINWHILERKI